MHFVKMLTQHKSVEMGILVIFIFLYFVPSFAQNGNYATKAKDHGVIYDVQIANNTSNKRKEITFDVVRSNGDRELRTFMDTESVISFNYSVTCAEFSSEYTLTLNEKSSKVVTAQTFSQHLLCPNLSSENDALTSEATNHTYVMHGTFDVKLRSGVIGIDFLEFTMDENNGDETSIPVVLKYDVIVIRKLRPVDTIFRIVIYFVQILVLTGFGAELDLEIVKETLRKPVAPVIGFCCQYIMMPLIAFGVAKLATDETTVALGIFVAGCCPGGGNSNMYTYLLNGDLSLSITMTTISTVAALAMLPVWLYSLGVLFIEDTSVTIPFSSVAISLAVLLIPLSIGVFLRTKFPKIATKLKKALTPVIIVSAIILITIGIYSNMFIFRLFEPQIVLAACLLPYIGYIIGGLVSTVFRQPWKRIKTIIIETGMQNASIAYILLTTSFRPPMGDLAAVAPVASAVMTPLPPFVVTVCYLTYQKCKKKYDPVTQNGDELQNKTKEQHNRENNEYGNSRETQKLT